MTKAIHLICGHNDRDQPNNMTFDIKARAFWSGNWSFSKAEAEALVGGWIYLHVSKAEPSYYGGPVLEFGWVRTADVAHEDRIRFRFQPSFIARGLAWRGQDHGRAWTGGLVDATQVHEQTR